MCLAIPGKVLSIYPGGELKMARVDFGGVEMDICMEFLTEAREGDYILAHVGTALTVISEEDARETLAALRELDQVSPLSDSLE